MPNEYRARLQELPPGLIRDGESATIESNPDAPPALLRVQGPTAAFTITNEDTGDKIVYDSTRPGGVAIAEGHFADIDRNGHDKHAWLDGERDNGTDLITGFDPEWTSFFEITGEPQRIRVDGADLQVMQELRD